MVVTYDNWVLTPREAGSPEEAEIARRLVFLRANVKRFPHTALQSIEVLGAEDALVLTPVAPSAAPVQTNQYGQPTRRARQTLTLPLSGPVDDGYSEEVLELLAGKLDG